MASTDLDTQLTELEKQIGHTFHDPRLLRQALTHSSVTGRGGADRPSYERLEFLGDRVLGLIVADMLIDRFPDEAEGALARRHAFLVSREALAEVAQVFRFGRFVYLSKGEAESGGRDNPAMLADVCEALIGALYRDGGLMAASAFVMPHWTPLLSQNRTPPRDAKTTLQEWAQGQGLPLPAYQEVNREGPAHDPKFTVSVYLTGYQPCYGQGRSKRLAEQDAAGRMLMFLNSDENQ